MILVTGAQGMMGGYFAQVYRKEEIYLTGRDEFDVCDLETGDQLFARIRPHLVIHLAAETDVDHCEKYPDHAFRTSIVGAQNVGRLASKYNSEVLYASTTGIFDGKKASLYTEFDQPNPITIYGKAKYEAEKIIAHVCPRSYILRAGWVFGGGPDRDKKFVGKMISLVKDKNEVFAVNDKVGSPTYALDFVVHARKIAESGFYGTYHVTNTGACTRYDIACELVKLLGLKTDVKPCSSAMFPLPAPRPANDSARNYKLELLGMNQMRNWREALAEYVSAWPRAANMPTDRDQSGTIAAKI